MGLAGTQRGDAHLSRGTITKTLLSQYLSYREWDMAGAFVYQINVYRLAREIASSEERIRVMTEILASIPIDAARTRHELFRVQIEILEDSLKILRQRYANEVRRLR